MKKILIITDDISNYGRYRSLLENVDIDISHRSSVREAMWFTRNRKVDLIIIDLDIPKFKNKYVNIPKKFRKRSNVLNIVNSITERALEECIKMKCKVLKKPFDDEILRSYVNRLISWNEDMVDFKAKDCFNDSPFYDVDNHVRVKIDCDNSEEQESIICDHCGKEAKCEGIDK